MSWIRHPVRVRRTLADETGCLLPVPPVLVRPTHGPTCQAERVPPACPVSRSQGVNSGHSRHLSLSSFRSALAHVRPLITAQSSKLAMRVRFPLPTPPHHSSLWRWAAWGSSPTRREAELDRGERRWADMRNPVYEYYDITAHGSGSSSIRAPIVLASDASWPR